MKTCNDCEQTKALEEFKSYNCKTKGLRYRHVCRECDNRRDRDRYRENTERKSEEHLKRKYNMDAKDRENMLTEQNGRCKICSIEISIKSALETGTKAVIDHCHETGKVRGLLCNNCNTGLGMFKDNKISLAKAIEYLYQAEGYPDYVMET